MTVFHEAAYEDASEYADADAYEDSYVQTYESVGQQIQIDIRYGYLPSFATGVVFLVMFVPDRDIYKQSFITLQS